MKVEPTPGLLVTPIDAAQQRGETLGDGEAKAGAAEISGGRGIGLRERLEQPAHLLFGHADAAVRHLEQNMRLAGRAGLPCDGKPDLALLGELRGVAQAD